MKKRIVNLLVFLALAACQSEQQTSPLPLEEMVDNSTELVSEERLNSSGCQFEENELNGLMEMNCEGSADGVSLDQIYAIRNYQKTTEDFLDTEKASTEYGVAIVASKSLIVLFYSSNLMTRASTYFLSVFISKKIAGEFDYYGKNRLYSDFSSLCVFRYDLDLRDSFEALEERIEKLEPESRKSLFGAAETLLQAESQEEDELTFKDSQVVKDFAQQIMELQP